MTAKTLSARAFEVGRAAGLAAGNWLAESVHAVGEILPANMTPAQYRTIRAEWVRVEPVHGEGSLVEITGQGQRMRVGRYLRPELRSALARELRQALRLECTRPVAQALQLEPQR